MVYADLHCHTTRSDGSMALEDVPDAARRAGVEVVAVTDHDRIHPDLPPVVECEGTILIHGIELRVETGHERVDLLGYAVDPTPALTAELERIQRDRIQRAERIVDCVEERLGVELDVDCEPGVGRPHVARAIDAHPGVEYDYEGAFEGLIGSDDPCYVARDVPSFERGRDLLAESCALVGLAHPLRYDTPERALDLAADLDAVERYYPYDREADPAPVEAVIEENDLLATGGSDAHDDRLGRAGLPPADYEPIATRLPDPA